MSFERDSEEIERKQSGDSARQGGGLLKPALPLEKEEDRPKLDR